MQRHCGEVGARGPWPLQIPAERHWEPVYPPLNSTKRSSEQIAMWGTTFGLRRSTNINAQRRSTPTTSACLRERLFHITCWETSLKETSSPRSFSSPVTLSPFQLRTSTRWEHAPENSRFSMADRTSTRL